MPDDSPHASISRLRLTEGSVARHHPEGEVVFYEDHAKEVERLRVLLTKSAEYARAWKQYAQGVRPTPPGENGVTVEHLLADLRTLTEFVVNLTDPDEPDVRAAAARLRAALAALT